MEKAIEVTLKGKMNAVFIVKNPKKIEKWKALANANQGGFVQVSYKDLKIKN